MDKQGTAENEYMHESLDKDAVKYDLSTEEIITALADDNKQLQSDLKEARDLINRIQKQVDKADRYGVGMVKISKADIKLALENDTDVKEKDGEEK